MTQAEDLLDLIRAGRGLVARIVCGGWSRLWRGSDALEAVVLDRVESPRRFIYIRVLFFCEVLASSYKFMRFRRADGINLI